MLRDINSLPARFGSPDSLEAGFSQYLPVHQGIGSSERRRPHRAQVSKRYAFAAAPLKRAVFSSAEYPAARCLKAFHST
jgi:hypothetical protein